MQVYAQVIIFGTKIALPDYMNKNYFIAIIAIFSFGCHGLLAQKNKEGCDNHYFNKGSLSTSSCYENNSSFGHARAYNRKGEVIYEKSIRKVAGHSHVLFTWY